MKFWAFPLVTILLVTGLPTGSTTAATPTSTTWSGQSDGIWISEFSAYTVMLTEKDLARYLRSGDGIAVVLSSNASHFLVSNTVAVSLHLAFPNVTLRGYTSLDGQTRKAGGLAWSIANISALYTQLSADWEVNGPIEFNPNGTVGVQYFQNFSKIVRATGRTAIGYPSGRGVLGDYSHPPDRWNYSAFAKVSDGMTIETQGYCGGNLSRWIAATHRILAEYNASGLALGPLSLQISLGVGGNGVNATDAIACATYWRAIVHGNVFLWWGPAHERELITVLKGLGR